MQLLTVSTLVPNPKGWPEWLSGTTWYHTKPIFHFNKSTNSSISLSLSGATCWREGDGLVTRRHPAMPHQGSQEVHVLNRFLHVLNAALTTQDRPYFYTNTNSRSVSGAVQSTHGSVLAANENPGSPSPDGSDSLWVTIGTATGVVVCLALAVAIVALVAYHFKRRRGGKKDEKLPLMESIF